MEVLKRYGGNPILKPLRGNLWESRRVFNCAATYEEGRIHIVYRAQGEDDISRLGYASSPDGIHVDERLSQPIFHPQHSLEELGCEDPRITKVGSKFYMSYTAYGRSLRWKSASKRRLAQIGITSISVDAFLEKEWSWGRRVYPFPGVDDKNCVIFPGKFNGKYVMYHRIPPHIWIAYSDNMENWSKSYHKIVMRPREWWEQVKIGSGAPPIRLSEGWLLVYHGVDRNFNYRLGLALIHRNNPEAAVRLKIPVLEPKESYKTAEGENVVFSCGAVLLDDDLLVYYGAADRFVGVAKADIAEILTLFEKKHLVSQA